MARATSAVVIGKFEQIIPWFTLFLLLVYTVLILFHVPYLGFDFNPSDGSIQEVFGDSSLQVGDRIHAVDGFTFAEWKTSLRRPLFAPAQPGDTIALEFYRNEQLQKITWTVDTPTWAEILARIIDIWPLGYFFWLAGVATVLLLRPKSSQQRLFAIFFFLTSIWIVSGTGSRWNLWEVSVVFHMAIWLCVPVYLHLHWSFPRNLRSLPPFVFPFLYLLGAGAAILEWYELQPKYAYALGFVVALLGSLLFLIVHYARRPHERRQLAIILYAFFFAVVPVVVLSIAAASSAAPRLGGVALLALPVLPVSYFYAIYRHQLGGVEMRTNRLITIFLYLIVLGTGIVALSIGIALLPNFPGRSIAANLIIGLIATLTTLKWYAPFERWIEVHLLGIPRPAEGLLESYLLRITTSLSKTGLAHILRDEIAPSLLIRQSALLINRGAGHELLYAHGVQEDEIAPLAASLDLLEGAESHLLHPRQTDRTDASWVRLSLPLTLGERRLGLWLLGKHDPDDIYTSREITLLENIARQTAMAMINIEQAEQLQAFYRTDIQRHEAERTRLAQTLHDEILNQAAIAYNCVETSALSERFEREYALLKEQIRRMIGDLRPATLRWGLHIALEELVDNLNERSNGRPLFEFSIPYSQEHYGEQCEDQLYRIVQQASENALRHAQATRVQIAGHLDQTGVVISIQDDGVGFDPGEMEFSRLLERKHYGLIGMYERARLIGAEVVVNSHIGNGAQIHVNWANDKG